MSLHFVPKNISDKDILSMLSAGNPKAWEYVYDKYSPAMYGIICRRTSDKVIAEHVLANAFFKLQQQQAIPATLVLLYPWLLRYTFSFATAELKRYGIEPIILLPPKKAILLHLLCTEATCIQDAAAVLDITETDIKVMLRQEVTALRQQDNWSTIIH